MILWWACLTLVLRMVILRTTRGQDRKRRFGSFCSWISTMVWRTAALSAEGGNRRLVQDLAADDVDRAHVGVPVGVGAEFVGRFGDEHLCRVVGDQQSQISCFTRSGVRDRRIRCWFIWWVLISSKTNSCSHRCWYSAARVSAGARCGSRMVVISRIVSVSPRPFTMYSMTRTGMR